MPATPSQTRANRRNAQRSTGPRTDQGKAVSSRNRFEHGFCGRFSVLPDESQRDFDSLLDALRIEHAPSTPTEDILVDRMAQHFWLSRRAQLLQSQCLLAGAHAGFDDAQKSLALFLRYQTANDRAFSRCLHDLLKLRFEKRKTAIGFERERQDAAQADRRQEAHNARVRLVTAKAEEQELENDIKSTVQARLPGHTALPFNLFKQVLSTSIEEFAQRLDRDPALAKIMKAV